MALSDLISPQTAATLQSYYLAFLQMAGFPTTGYQSGSTPLTLVQLATQVLADMTSTVQNVAAGGFLQSFQPGSAYTPVDGWLDLKSISDYQTTRNAGQACVRSVQLTDVGGGGPYTIVVGQLIVTSTTGLTFVNTTGGTLTKSGTLTLTFQASSVGASYNVIDGAISTLTTPLPGVAITFPNGANAQTITTSGLDPETSQALATRCAAKWATIGGGANASAYRYWATTVAPAITRVQVLEAYPTGGKVTIYCAGPLGPAGTADIATVAAYLGVPFSQSGVRPLGITTIVLPAVAYAITLTGNVNVASAQLTNAQASISANLQTISQTSAIGGTIYLSQLIDAIQKVPGVQNVNLTLPVADVSLAALGYGLVANLVNSLTFVGV